MIEFMSEEVRHEFHLLPLDIQRDYLYLGERIFRGGRKLRILYVINWGNDLEIEVRIYKQSNERSG